MAHPLEHCKTSVKKWKGTPLDYERIHVWLDETKAWVGTSMHRMFRHHSEGIFECERVFGKSFINSDGKTVYTRYVAEQHVKEDCNNYIPTAKEWVDMIASGKPEKWAIKTLKIED
jgi:hypothetical protein